MWPGPLDRRFSLSPAGAPPITKKCWRGWRSPPSVRNDGQRERKMEGTKVRKKEADKEGRQREGNERKRK